MVQAILAYIVIFSTLFLSSVSISFTVLKSQTKPPQTSKFRILQQKRVINGLLRNFNELSSSHKSIQRNLELKKTALEYEILTTESLLNEMELNQNRLNHHEKILNSNDNKLAKMLK